MKGPPWSGNLLPLPLAALQTASVSSADCIRELSSSPMKLQESEESFQMLGPYTKTGISEILPTSFMKVCFFMFFPSSYGLIERLHSLPVKT